MGWKDNRICVHCGKPVNEGEGVYYVGRWYHRDCFVKLYGKKFGLC